MKNNNKIIIILISVSLFFLFSTDKANSANTNTKIISQETKTLQQQAPIDQLGQMHFTYIQAIVQVGVRVGTMLAKAIAKQGIKSLVKSSIVSLGKTLARSAAEKVLMQVGAQMFSSQSMLNKSQLDASAAFASANQMANALPPGQSVANLEALEKAKKRNEAAARDLVPVATYANLKTMVAADAAYKASVAKAANPIQDAVKTITAYAKESGIEPVSFTVGTEQIPLPSSSETASTASPHDLANIPEGFTKEQWQSKCDKAESLVTNLQTAEAASAQFKAAVDALQQFLATPDLNADDPATDARFKELLLSVETTGDSWAEQVNKASAQSMSYTTDASFLGNDETKTIEGLEAHAQKEAAFEKEVLRDEASQPSANPDAATVDSSPG